jgi:hypothetical protein
VATCRKVFAQQPNGNGTFEVRVQDVIHAVVRKAEGFGNGTCADCVAYNGPDGPQSIAFYFMLVNAGGEIADGATTATWETSYDLRGPHAPTSLKVGIGEERLVLEWDSGSTQDAVGYQFYCDSGQATDGGASPAAVACPGTAVGVAGASATGGAAGGGASGAAGSSGSVGTGGTSGSSTTGGQPGASNPLCPSTALIAGQQPPTSGFRCGSVNGLSSTEGSARGLDNGVTYAVGVAAFDSVDNVGPLSPIECGTPQPVTDFFESYREAGGKGGGGFCALERRAGGPGANALFLTLAMLGLLLRRRR